MSRSSLIHYGSSHLNLTYSIPLRSRSDKNLFRHRQRRLLVSIDQGQRFLCGELNLGALLLWTHDSGFAFVHLEMLAQLAHRREMLRALLAREHLTARQNAKKQLMRCQDYREVSSSLLTYHLNGQRHASLELAGC